MSDTINIGQIAERAEMVNVDCDHCWRTGRLRTDLLLARHGADLPIPNLPRILAGHSPRMIDKKLRGLYGVHSPGLADLFV